VHGAMPLSKRDRTPYLRRIRRISTHAGADEDAWRASTPLIGRERERRRRWSGMESPGRAGDWEKRNIRVLWLGNPARPHPAPLRRQAQALMPSSGLTRSHERMICCSVSAPGGGMRWRLSQSIIAALPLPPHQPAQYAVVEPLPSPCCPAERGAGASSATLVTINRLGA
jgi:hypothetical protein